MEETLLFGEKKKFAIELGATKTPKKFKLGMWFNNQRYGNFKKAGELKYSIKQYHVFVNNKEQFYLDLFDGLSPTEIFHYLIGVFLTNAAKKIDPAETQLRQNFYLFFGDQFVNQTGGSLFLYRNGIIGVIIKRPMDGPIDSYEIDFRDFCKVFDEYIAYCSINQLV